jgi:hypothetical protein
MDRWMGGMGSYQFQNTIKDNIPTLILIMMKFYLYQAGYFNTNV